MPAAIFLFSLLILSPFPALAGYFDGPECGPALEEIAAHRGSSYKEDANKMGLKGDEEREYIDRRVKHRYVHEEMRSAVAEVNEFGAVIVEAKMARYQVMNTRALVRMTHGTGPDRVTPSEKEAGEIVKAIHKSGDQRDKDGILNREKHPFTWSIIEKRPPLSDQEDKAIEDLAVLRMALVDYRKEMMNAFTAQPLNQKIQDLPQDLLESVSRSVIKKNVNEVMEVLWKKKGYEEQANGIKRDFIRVYSAPPDLAALRKNFLDRPDIPEQVKEVVRKELEFENEFSTGFNHPFLYVFLIRADQYFKEVHR